MSDFSQFDLPESLQAALRRIQFKNPTPIQEKAIGPALAGHDLIAMAQTGTGKTAAFALPLLARLHRQPDATALVLAPTRELAAQIHRFFRDLDAAQPVFKSTLLIGGASMHYQNQDLKKKPRVLVATPGRLVDHLRIQPRLLQKLIVLVMDEADRMLDMGFLPQLKTILRHLPHDRQTMMFTATFPTVAKDLAAAYLRKPVEVSVGAPSRPVEKIDQKILQTTQQGKNELLLKELDTSSGSVLIFTRTKHRTDRLSLFLQKSGFKVARLHGNRSQSQRQVAIEGFRSGKFEIMVATDIAARGLDIATISQVINYDLPQVPEDYIHRIGRTARNGRAGQSLAFVVPEERGLWRSIERLGSRAPRQSAPGPLLPRPSTHSR